MNRVGHLWQDLVSWENLLLAYRKARRAKRHSLSVAKFSCALEPELLQLQQELVTGQYRPGAYRQFCIYDRKPRVISAAPFRDRVVHHAIMNLIEPPLDRRFIDDTYACRKGKGVHAAVNRYQQFAQRYPYALKLDIRQYFPSIDHDVLNKQLQSRIKDQPLLALLALIIDASPPSSAPFEVFPDEDLIRALARNRGIPIGNLTSQFFANLYLDDFDHWVKQVLQVPAYLRYVDDMILLDADKNRLWQSAEAISAYLLGLKLRLHERKQQIYRTATWVDVLGYRVSASRRLLRNDNGYRFRRKLRHFAKRYAEYRMDWADFNPSVQSWIGHAGHAETFGLRQAMFSMLTFQRAGT